MVILEVSIFTSTYCYFQSIHNCSLIVLKQIENIDKEEGSLEKPYSKNNEIVGPGSYPVENSIKWMWYGLVVHSWEQKI